MTADGVRIGIMAPGSPIDETLADRVCRLARERCGARLAEIRVHPQCFLSSGHFAGDDGARADAFVELANDPDLDAVWFARGGYGSCRITEGLLPRLTETARRKHYLGYSDPGALLALLYGAGFPHVAHGPMPIDLVRPGGEEAAARALAWLVDGDPTTLEGGLAPHVSAVAFNIAILSSLIGTPVQPDLTGHVLLVEEVSEYMYRMDRTLFHITSNAGVRRCAGIRLGRCSRIPVNQPDFGQDEEAIVRSWCARSGIPWLGRADIGHDIHNKIVPFGRAPAAD